MIDKLMSLIAPHHCCGCDKIGTLLCDGCKYNIIQEAIPVCLICHRPTAKMWLCHDCKSPYERAWACGERTGKLKAVIDKYKFHHSKSAFKDLGDLLDEVLPYLPAETIVVPIPTIAPHIRQRGYDHMDLIARYFARKRNLGYERLLIRNSSSEQKEASATKRISQAKTAFKLSVQKLDPNRPYLIVDDIITTGATLKYAAKTLRKGGAQHIWVAVIARQTLD